MNTKWSEKTLLQKVMDVISWIALCIWIIFEILDSANKVKYADIVSCLALGITCICEAFSFWSFKRAISYVAILGFIIIILIIVLKSI